MIAIRENGSAETAVALVAVAAGAHARSAALVRHYGALVQAATRANTHSRPGPAASDQYRAAIGLVTGSMAGNPFAAIGTDEPQAGRLEAGFVGTDRLGRHYRQRPYPHFGPALDRYEAPFALALAAGAFA